jgi:hypothetical protein
MRRGNRTSKPKKIISLILIITILLYSILIGISFQIPNVEAAVNHNISNIEINAVTDYGRILMAIYWDGLQTARDQLTGFSFLGLVIDQDNYNHTPGAEDIAECFSSYPYGSPDDFSTINSIQMVIDNGTTQKSIASFQNTNPGTGDPNDMLINQTVWTVSNKDWAILQWNLLNLKGIDITGLSIGLEVPISQIGSLSTSGLGRDNGDDVDSWDAGNNVYYAQDDGGGGTTMGFASASSANPLTLYYSKDYHPETYDDYKNYWQNESWLYSRINAPNTVEGLSPGNRTSLIGWRGETLPAGQSKTFSLVIGINDTYTDMITAINDAQNYYLTTATGIQITEFSDSDSSTQRIEIFNFGFGETSLVADGYFLSNDGGTSPLLGTWNKDPLPDFNYAVFTLDPGENIGPEGDTIGLYRDLGGGNKVLVDGTFSYGQDGIIPDPLSSESVGRRYDSGLAMYTNDWLRNASFGPTWGAQNDVGYIVSSPELVINRVLYNPYPGEEEEGYVELRYNGFVTHDISNYRIVCDDVFIIPQGTYLNDTNKYFMIKHSDLPIFFSNMNPDGDNIYLYDNNNNLIDMVGWISPFTQGNYMARVPDGNGTHQGFNDISSISAGWVFDFEPKLMITEIQVDDENNARFEIYNPRGGDKVLSTRWSFDVETSPFTLTGSWTPVTDIISSGSYALFDRTGGAVLKPDGDTISLHYKGSSMVDEVSYGIRGLPPDPVFGESSARIWDDNVFGYSNNWTRNASSGPTWSLRNDVDGIFPPTNIVLNRVMFNPLVDAEGYVELMYTESGTFDISGWTIVCDDVFTIPATPSLSDTAPFYVFKQSDMPSFFTIGGNMDAFGDNVYLYDASGDLVDMVGWNSAHNQGRYMGRIPDGTGTHQGFNDTTSMAAGWSFDNSIVVQLTEFYADPTVATIELYNPRGGDKVLDARWSIESAESGGALTFTWNTGTISANGGYEYTTGLTAGIPGVEGDTLSLYYNDGGGPVIMDSVSYGVHGKAPDPLSGESTARYWNELLNDYENNWTRDNSPTFGNQNDIPKPNLITYLFLNEVLFNPLVSTDSFIEIYINWGGLNVSGYKIVCDQEYIIPDNTVLSGVDQYFCFTPSMSPSFFNDMNSSGDNIYLYDNNNVLMDMVGWNSSHNQGESMSRIPDGNGTKDGYDDISSENAGWTFGNQPTAKLINIFTPERVKYGDLNEVVYFNLTVTNKQAIDDTILISNYTINGYSLEVLDNSDFSIISKIFLPKNSSSNIIIKVYLPSTLSDLFWDNITIIIQSENYSTYIDSITLMVLTKNSVYAGLDQSVNEGDIVHFGGSAISFASNPMWPVEISGDGHYIAVGWGDYVSFFSTASNLPFWTHNTGGRVGDIKLSEDGRYMTVGSYQTIYYFDTMLESPLWSIQLADSDTRYDADPGNRFDMTRDGRYVASAAAGRYLKIFDAFSPNPTDPYMDYFFGHHIAGVRFSGDGRYLAFCSLSNSYIGLIYVPSKSVNWTASPSGNSFDAALSYDGSMLFTHAGGGSGGRFYLYNTDPQFLKWDYQNGYQVLELDISDDGTFAVSGNRNSGGSGEFFLWNTSSSSPIWILHNSFICDAVDIDYNANYVVGGSRDKNIYLFSQFGDGLSDWSAVDGIPIFTYTTSDMINYNSVSISGDGKYFAGGSWDGTAYLFSTDGSPHLRWSWRPNFLADQQGTLTYNWDLNALKDSNGDGNFTNDVDATGPSPSHVYGDNGFYNATLKVTDGSGSSMYDNCQITVNNIKPSIEPFGPFSVNVGEILILNTSASDLGSDDLTFTWGWGDGTSDNVTTYYNNGLSSDPYPSPNGNFPFTGNNSVLHTYINPGTFTINLTVEDDDGGITWYTAMVTINGTTSLTPTLFINVSSDGNDVILYWDLPDYTDVNHYLIYRSTSRTGFDFNNPWINTLIDIELGESIPIPQRTMWNDTNAALVGDINFEEQYFYIIRAVYDSGTTSGTSRTVGKWTKSFPQGEYAFSLPFKSLYNLTVDYLTTIMNAEYIQYMDSIDNTWRRHNQGDGGINNTVMKLGEGYVVKFTNPTDFTFTGLPGCMISYNNGFFGFDPITEAECLSVTVLPNGDVNLTWQEPGSMIDGWYEVYYSNKRDGFFGTFGKDFFLACATVNFGNNYATHVDANSIDPGSRLYYMVVPFNTSGVRGSSTYTIGIWTEEYSSGYDTFGIPLKIIINHTADWYCDNIPRTVGINYFILDLQEWGWHPTRMSKGAFDPILVMSDGYQISTSSSTKFIFIGI